MLLISVYSTIFSIIFLYLSFAIVAYGDDLNDTPDPIQPETLITRSDLSDQKEDEAALPWSAPLIPPANLENLNLPGQLLAKDFAADSAEQGNLNQDHQSDMILAGKNIRGRPDPGKPALGPPEPANPNLLPWERGYWPGHPQNEDDIEREDTADPETGYRQPIRQPEGSCEKGKLYCCRPNLVLCYDFHERLPECVPRQQKCCDYTDQYFNGINCRDPRPAKKAQTSPKTQNQQETSDSDSSKPNSESDQGAGPAASAILDFLLWFEGLDSILGLR